MAEAAKGFGQYVLLEIFDLPDRQGRQVFSTDQLRVDFSIASMGGYERASIQIYNLSDDNIVLMKEGTYMTLSTKLHGLGGRPIMKNYFISNAFTETRLPNRITTLYGVGNAVGMLEQQMNARVGFRIGKPFLPGMRMILEEPTLRNAVYAAVEMANEKNSKKIDARRIQVGPDYKKPEFRNYRPYPDDPIIDKKIGSGIDLTGSLDKWLKRWAGPMKAHISTENGRIVISHTPSSNSVEKSQYPVIAAEDKSVFKVSLDNLRTNPMISPAKMELVINLDPEVRSGTLINTETVFTQSVLSLDSSDALLRVAKDFVKDTVNVSSPYYQILEIIHVGSNYTEQWESRLRAFSASSDSSN